MLRHLKDRFTDIAFLFQDLVILFLEPAYLLSQFCHLVIVISSLMMRDHTRLDLLSQRIEFCLEL